MDDPALTSHGHGQALPLPFHSPRDFQLNPHQFHHLQPHNPEGLMISQTLKRDCDEDSGNSTRAGTRSEGKEPGRVGMVGESSGSEEPTRRPRGRPAGSKNKPKPPIIITRDSANSLRTHVMEVVHGQDAGHCRERFHFREEVSTGCLHPELRQPPSGGPPAAVVALRVRFEILSLSGSFLPPPAPPEATGLTVYLGGGQGQVVGGGVVGALTGSGQVVIMAASFSNAAYERLPLEDEEESAKPMQGGGRPPSVPNTQQHLLVILVLFSTKDCDRTFLTS